MLHYAVVFFIIALIAALLGFTGIASGAAGIADPVRRVHRACAGELRGEPGAQAALRQTADVGHVLRYRRSTPDVGAAGSDAHSPDRPEHNNRGGP